MAFNPPVVDTFTGSDGSINARVATPGGQTWTAPLYTAHTAIPIASNVLAGAGGADRSAVLGGVDFGPDVQIAATIATWNATNPLLYLQCRIQEDSFPGDFAISTKYMGLIANATGLDIHRTIAGADTLLGTIGGGGTAWASGYKFGMEVVESGGSTTISAYQDTGSGWTSMGTPITDSNASRPVTAGHVGIEIENNTSTLDDFRVQTSSLGTSASDNPLIGFLGRGAS